MKALILNSGLGKRMGDLTQDRPKCMVEICDGYAAIDFQLEKLLKCGVTNIVMTTGPFDDKLQSHIKARYPQADVTYVNNPVYEIGRAHV